MWRNFGILIALVLTRSARCWAVLKDRIMSAKIALIAATAALALFATAAQAAPLTLDTDGTPTFQQTQNSPCVIGDPSCNNPAGFSSTTLASAQSTYTAILSPMYTVGQIRGIVGNMFVVGIDVNTTTQP